MCVENYDSWIPPAIGGLLIMFQARFATEALRRIAQAKRSSLTLINWLEVTGYRGFLAGFRMNDMVPVIA